MPTRSVCMDSLASAYQADGRPDLALPLVEEETLAQEARAWGRTAARRWKAWPRSALAYERAGKLDLALPLYEQTLKRMQAKLGPDNYLLSPV